jgi:hypothetical protein
MSPTSVAIRPLYETYPPWLAIALAFGIVFAGAILLGAVTLLAKHVQREAERAQMHADHEEWLRTHPVAPAAPPSLGRLIVRSRQAPAGSPDDDRASAPGAARSAVPNTWSAAS